MLMRGLARSTARAFSSASRVFPTFSCYGNEAVFQASPIAPQYTASPNGNYLKTKRMGSMMLSWAKAKDEGYNYNNKAFFSLSPSEIGLVLELLDSRMSKLSFSHSPNMNASNDAPSATRTLKVARSESSEGEPTVVFSIAGDFKASTALNVGEARVLKELLSYSLPRIYGFHSVLEGPLTIDGASAGGSGGYSSGNGSSSGGNFRTGGKSKPAAEWPF